MFKKYIFLICTFLIFFSCSQNKADKNSATKELAVKQAKKSPLDCITEAEVIEAQRQWGDGIVAIGKIFSEGGDYKKAAADHINNLYGYDISKVLFKPTLASVEQFRGTFDSALSYFVGGNDTYKEDNGFAIAPYTNVRWENFGILNSQCNVAIAMGNYYFTKTNGQEIKVEYTLAYIKDKKGKLRIVAHKSALPYGSE